MNLRDTAKGRWPKLIILTVAIIILLVVGAVAAVRHTYFENLKPVTQSQRHQFVTVPEDSSVDDIAKILKKQSLIRSDWAFKIYVRNKNAQDKLQAGTYTLRSNQSVSEIVDVLTQGQVATDLVTILPGQRVDQIRSGLIRSGFSTQDVDRALDPANYKSHPALVDKPAGANLEGYLYPESFQKNSQTLPDEIVKKSLDEMQKYLTPDLRTALVAQGLTVHQGIILASIVEQEVSKGGERPQVAQVFLKRLRSSIKLESDATAPYGAIVANQPPSLGYPSPYNTYQNTGLPPTPISNVSESSLKAVAYPANTDWLYFVSGDDGITYFSKTLEEHQALTAQHCKKMCRQ